MTPAGSTSRDRQGSLLGGRYRVGRLLGEGGMGAVYEAHVEGAPHQRFAVKVLHEEMAANPTVVERFLGEGDLCKRLDHPGILRVFEVGNQAGVPYLVMELLEGRALVDYTEQQQRLPLNFAVTVCAGVLHALDYAHANGVIHRDLKPENVFLVPGPGGHWQTKLLDFGIARAIDAAGGGRRRTATGVLLGTPGYMSPEQVKAARNVDHRADLWAVGVMFYEMVAGSPAFPSDGDDPNNIWGLISAVLTKEPVPLSVYDRHLQPFDGFIAKALAKDIDKRFASAREMCEEILRVARGEVRTSDPQSPQASAFTREQRVPINSRGEMDAIPGLTPYGNLGATQWQPPGQPPQSGTVPTGIEQQANAARQNLAGTVPMAPGTTAASYAPMSAAGPSSYAAGPGSTANSYAPMPQAPPSMGGRTAPSVPPPASLAATALAPPGMTPPSTPPPPFGVAASPAPHIPKHGTAPSGYKPPIPHVPTGPSPLDGPIDGEHESRSMVPWIVLGVVLVLALGGALVWALR
ncbi:MAG: protein kinase domain-containing protein [Polyangiales bacterium]